MKIRKLHARLASTEVDVKISNLIHECFQSRMKPIIDHRLKMLGFVVLDKLLVSLEQKNWSSKERDAEALLCEREPVVPILDLEQ